MIRHRTARRIASEWYAGQWAGLYALSSSGAIIVNGDFSRIPATFVNDDGESVLADNPDTLAQLTAVHELLDCLYQRVKYPQPLSNRNYHDLHNLIAYVKRYGPRGPVAGWSSLSW